MNTQNTQNANTELNATVKDFVDFRSNSITSNEKFSSLSEMDKKEVLELITKIEKKQGRYVELYDLQRPVISKGLNYMSEIELILSGKKEELRIQKQLEALKAKQEELLAKIGKGV